MQEIDELTNKLKRQVQQRPAVKAPLLASRPPVDWRCVPGCDVCGGLGLVRPDVPPWSPRFGKLEACPNAPAPTLAGLYGEHGLLLSEARDLTYGSVAPLNGTQAAQEAMRKLVARGHGWLYVYGQYGTAKSVMLKAAVAEAVRAGKHARYITALDMLDELRQTYSDGTNIGAVVEHFSTIDVLSLDEVEKGDTTDWAQKRIFQILNRRYDLALSGQTITVIASNVAPEAAFDKATASRARDGRFVVVSIDGGDLRPAMEWS